eukprot:4028264-Prymnesium_polylepis.2
MFNAQSGSSVPRLAHRAWSGRVTANACTQGAWIRLYPSAQAKTEGEATGMRDLNSYDGDTESWRDEWSRWDQPSPSGAARTSRSS